jgi:pimeloyl-ACP methyl ester carboxylesterase
MKARSFLRAMPALAVVVAIVAPPLSTPASAQGLPSYEQADCAVILKPPVDNPLNALIPGADSSIRCGYVSVPEEHDRSNGRTIKLAVAVLRATPGEGETAKPDPLVMLQGGPGGGTIDTYNLLMRNNDVRKERDIVLFDQRGTGKSLPALYCDETYQLAVQDAERRVDYDESLRNYDAALMACRDRLTKAGVNLNAFDSIENARDIDAVRVALGYDRVNLYGVSYGTLLALHAMREVPDHIRSVILDAVVPTQNNFVIEAAGSENRVLTEFFNACAADSVCDRDYPNLEKVYYDQVEQLSKTPARIRVSDPNTGRTYNSVIDGDGLQGVVFQSMYAANMIPLLPQMIYDLRAGNTDTLGNIASLFMFDKSVAQGMYFAVVCAEDSDYDPKDALKPDLRPQIAKNAEKDAAAQQAICKALNVEQLPAPVDEPVTSDIPTLVLNGQFDPITPPANGAQAAETLTNSYNYTFPNTAHGAFQSEDCAAKIAIAFLNEPGTRPEDTCITTLNPPSFVGARDLVRAPVIGELLTTAPRDRQLQFSVLMIALLVMASGLVLLPVGWLARLIFKKNHPYRTPPFIANLMPWLVVLMGALLTAFVGGVFGAAIVSAGREELTFLAGVSRDVFALFTLPVGCALLTVLIVWGVVAGWRSGAWGLGRKLYRGTLALAAIASVAVLAMWNMVLTPLIQ